jgi:hypothetical protein
MNWNRIGAVVAASVLGTVVLGVAGGTSAYAESPPSCSSTVQIGSTAYLTVGGQTFASIKQFKGCGKNWGYVYVWAGYRSSHRSWSDCASVSVTNSSGVGEHDLEGLVCSSNKVETWSTGTNTLSSCTEASGMYGADPLEPVVGWVSTSVRC